MSMVTMFSDKESKQMTACSTVDTYTNRTAIKSSTLTSWRTTPFTTFATRTEQRWKDPSLDQLLAESTNQRCPRCQLLRFNSQSLWKSSTTDASKQLVMRNKLLLLTVKPWSKRFQTSRLKWSLEWTSTTITPTLTRVTSSLGERLQTCSLISKQLLQASTVLIPWPRGTCERRVTWSTGTRSPFKMP